MLRGRWLLEKNSFSSVKKSIQHALFYWHFLTPNVFIYYFVETKETSSLMFYYVYMHHVCMDLCMDLCMYVSTYL